MEEEKKEEEAVPLLLLPVHVCKVCFSPPTATEPSASSSSAHLRAPLSAMPSPSLAHSLARPTGDYLRQRSRHGWLLTREVIEYWEARSLPSPLLSLTNPTCFSSHTTRGASTVTAFNN